MSLAPLPMSGSAPPQRPRRVADTTRLRPPARVGNRHFAVAVAKHLLPLVALVLLALVVLWPEYREEQYAQLYDHSGIDPVNGELTDVRYNGVDQSDRPYTVTATSAHQVSSERIDLVQPKADITLQNGSWLMAQSHQGVYVQHDNVLDLTGNVVLYRDDGLTMVTDVATMDLKAGAASSVAKVHAEGPFGTLDAQGFSVTDSGTVIQFAGPGRLVLNGAGK
jgi:lipopolysaccharide export system protein LptC